MTSPSFTENMARHILNTEDSPARFERFCCDLFSAIDACIYVPTSWNYDQGKNGRTADLKNAEHPPVICVSLRKDSLKKATEDAENLAKKPHPPTTIRFCTITGDTTATEKLLDQIKGVFQSKLKNLKTVCAEGILQLAKLSVRNESVFQKYYRAELENLKAALCYDVGESAKMQLTGLRIALTTQFSDDANALRNDLHRNLILSSLYEGQKTLAGVCKYVTDSLHLPGSIQPDCLQPALENLRSTELVHQENGIYKIAPAGIDELEKRTEEGTENLVNGQQLLRALVVELTGDRIEQQDFARVWTIVQDEIANMFLTNGIYVVQSIQSIMSNSSTVSEHPDLYKSIHDLGRKIASLNIWGDRQNEVCQAFVDVFHETQSEAFKWLAQLGTIYVSLCSLGLESTAQQQIMERVRNFDLLLDTDIVLSYLAPGEPSHEAISSVVRTWQRTSGHIYVAPCVLEEAAYHAWIADAEYNEIWRDLDKYNDKEAQRIIGNVFVRSFRFESKGRYVRKYWKPYIQQFRGKSDYDYSKVEELLKDAYIFRTSDEQIDEAFADQIKNRLIEITEQGSFSTDDVPNEELDKFRRDGVLVAILLRHRSRQKNRCAVIVSSSVRLSVACEKKTLQSRLGALNPVAPIGALAYLLTMIPGVNMNLGSLKGLLFDIGYTRKIRGLDRIALKMIQASEEYFMPFARRATLRKRLDEQIGKTATELGIAKAKAAEKLERGHLGKESTTHILAESVDQVVQSKSEKRIQELQREIKHLRSK